MNFDLSTASEIRKFLGMKNVFLDLQSRQWRQVEGWNVRQLGQFSEEKALLGLRECWSCHSVVENKQSTLALAFSCDGNFMASSHLTHEIVIQKTRPFLHILHVLSAHPSTNRSPWCLTFHPSHPHHLLSGCLGGSVLLWDVQAGKCLCAWVSGISSPINSLVFLPSHPDHFLVAYDTCLCLMHYTGHKTETVWTSKTAAPEIKVRLVLHHPDCNKVLTAVTNHTPHVTGTTYGYSRRSSYRLQMYPYTFISSPDLENSSTGLLSMSVRVLSPQSVVLTSQFVISTNTGKGSSSNKLSVYSIDQHTFGQCLCSIALDQLSVLSLDLSECERFLLMSSSVKRLCYGYELPLSPPHKSRVKVFRMVKNETSLMLEPYCELSGIHSTNMARWLPSQSGEGCVCVGTQHGSVVRWSRRKARERVGERAKEVSKDFKLDWFCNINYVTEARL